MPRFVIFITITLLALVFPRCGDQVRDEFPRTDFVGYFDLNYSSYAKDVFTAEEDMDRHQVGINGIIVYRSSDQFFAFEKMCPYETKPSCSVQVNEEEETSVAECECCGSRFLIASETGDIIEGPAKRSLKTYRTAFDPQSNQLVVSSR
ncbi:MAG: Rieske 2Fe-2S domain-containing protein [Marinilabilia sp.]